MVILIAGLFIINIDFFQILHSDSPSANFGWHIKKKKLVPLQLMKGLEFSTLLHCLSLFIVSNDRFYFTTFISRLNEQETWSQWDVFRLSVVWQSIKSSLYFFYLLFIYLFFFWNVIKTKIWPINPQKTVIAISRLFSIYRTTLMV